MGKGDNVSLVNHLQLGEYLIRAKEIFNIQKIKYKTKDTWSNYVKNNTNISEPYERRHREVAALVQTYGKLKKLSVSFTELYSMRSKIKEVFISNIECGNWWKVAE